MPGGKVEQTPLPPLHHSHLYLKARCKMAERRICNKKKSGNRRCPEVIE
jgi:hypothetical protein